MAKVLWWGDSPEAHTGFGRVTKNIAERLVTNHGHEVSVLGINFEGDAPAGSPLSIYRANKLNPIDVYGQARIVEMLLVVNPDVVVVLQDPHVVLKFLFDNKWDEKRMLLRHRPVLAYMPVDGLNQPPVWDMLGKVTRRVAMAEWGRTWMPEAEVIRHGVDTTVFRPLSDGPMTATNGITVKTKGDAKALFGYDPDGFLVLRVDRNSIRKDYPAMIKALAPVMQRHSDIQVHLHCVEHDTAGTSLKPVISRFPDIFDQFKFAGGLDTYHGWNERDLAILYNAADLFVSTSWGEGFGLTLAEAAASGLPIIAQNVSAIPEVVGAGGLLIEPERLITVSSGQDQWLPDIRAFSDAIEHLYNAGGVRRKLGLAGRANSLALSWDTAAERFHAHIEELASQRPSEEQINADPE